MKYIIGSDECLKGDTFGGIIVAAVAANDKLREELKKIGVMDSKKVSDIKIPPMAALIRKICPHVVLELFPIEYNQKTLHGKATAVLNELHLSSATQLREELIEHECMHVVDEYPGCAVGDVHIIKAESVYIEVAAASILARDAGLKQIDLLTQSFGIKVPKGSTHVDIALSHLKRSGKDPKLFVKMHFSNVKKALG